jgi:hypothetical protein
MMSTDYTLSYGTHGTPEEGRCAMEWVSHLAGEPHSAEPACVSPVLRAFCTSLNDGLEDGPRQRLRLYLSRTIGTSHDTLDQSRAWTAMDWLIRAYTPTWLSVAGLNDAADRLRSLAVVSDVPDLTAALVELRSARQLARGAWGTGPAARLAPAAIAARATARETAWATAAAAAWAAARVGVGDIAGDRARAAARAAAGDAAATVARAARAGADRAAAREAVRAALAPTLEGLRESAFGLLDRMLPTVAHRQVADAFARSARTHAAAPPAAARTAPPSGGTPVCLATP